MGRKNNSFEHFKERGDNIHNGRYDYSHFKYIDYYTPGWIICRECGCAFLQTPHKHLSKKRGCYVCGIKKSAENRKMTNEEFKYKANLIHYNKYDYSETDLNQRDKKGRVKIICRKHGEFWQNINDHLHGHGCAKCCQSRLEAEIEIFLKENNIEFIPQANKSTFDWLGNLSLDFYLPKYNIAIECQGGQHFQPIEYFGGYEEFKIIQERDRRKFELCKEHNIPIIYYSNIDDNGSRSFFQEIIHDKEKILEELNKK